MLYYVCIKMRVLTEETADEEGGKEGMLTARENLEEVIKDFREEVF